ncbi:hypothetical protein [Streptomyces sp. NPDC051219]|uniref:imine reductase family protein n=1 Tax=Streptomyces sp. NPDC051219 TaxID=3155283 RepID=UPI003449A3FA
MNAGEQPRTPPETAIAPYLTANMSILPPILAEMAAEISEGKYPGDEANLIMEAAGIQHISVQRDPPTGASRSQAGDRGCLTPTAGIPGLPARPGPPAQPEPATQP